MRPRYVVRIEERVYLERLSDEGADFMRPDVTVLRPSGPPAPLVTSRVTGGGAGPAIVTLPMAERRREIYLTIRRRADMAVVTIVELLSPANKRPGSDGRQEYLNKREAVLHSATNLVEIDLLRGGERLPTVEPLPRGDYYVFVCRAHHRPQAEVYAWPLRYPLPTIPVPLAADDPDVALALQPIMAAVYDRAGYDYALDYSRPLELALSEPDSAWVASVLAARASP